MAGLKSKKGEKLNRTPITMLSLLQNHLLINKTGKIEPERVKNPRQRGNSIGLD